MSIKVKVTFAEGVSLEDVYSALEAAGIDEENPPEGGLSHQSYVENNRVVFVDEWQSQEVLDAFIDNVASPAFSKAGIPSPHVEVI